MQDRHSSSQRGRRFFRSHQAALRAELDALTKELDDPGKRYDLAEQSRDRMLT